MNVLSASRRALAWLALALAAGVAAPAGAAVTLQTDANGVLTGASGISISGRSGTYSVRFVDQVCADDGGLCNSFFFTTPVDAVAASQALLDSVFQDGAAGNFDTQPKLTLGCTGGLDTLCTAFTGFARVTGGVLVGYALNDVGLVVNDGVTNSSVGGPPFPDFGANSGATWAVWSADRITATVPEPSTVALLGVLALALPQLRRRRCG